MPDHGRERLTELDYEDCYSEALRIIHYKYDSVGVPIGRRRGREYVR